MAKRTLYPLFAAQDEPTVRPILDALKKKGFAVGKAHEPKKNDAVLFFLSKNLEETSPEIDAFLRFDAQKLDVIPVDLDGSTPPALIGNAIMARHSIAAGRYTTEELCDRISDAAKKPGAVSPKTWKRIAAAGAIVLLAVIGVAVWRILAGGNAKETAAGASPFPTEAPVLSLPDDIPPEDVTKIIEITFIGDTYRWYTSDDHNYRNDSFNRGYNDFSYRYWTDEGAHWISKEDGHEFPLTHYDDLSWIASLPNLKYVTFCAVDAEIPDLSGLKKLVGVFYCDNRIGTLEWLRGASLHFIEYHGSDVTDFSPLSDCKNFNSANIDLVFSETADFSGFCPPSLRWLILGNGYDLQSIDLSGLNRCTDLAELHLDHLPVPADFSLNGCKKLNRLEVVDLPLRDLSFASDCTALTELQLWDLNLNSLDGIENLKKLRSLNMENVRIHDVSAVAGCTDLEEFWMSGYTWNEDIRDLSVLASLPKLRTIGTHTTNISDLNFLNDLQIKTDISLHFSSGSLTDFSGLASIQSFSEAHINLNGRDFGTLVLPYVQNAVFRNLNLYDCAGVDLSALPRVTGVLMIDYGELTSLKGLDQPVMHLSLNNCQYLTSLDGIQDLPGFGDERGELYVESCPRLTDWSALDGMRLNRLEFCASFSLPDFSKTNARNIRFSYMDEDVLPDLSCLNGLDRTQMYDFDFSEQQDLPDLLPLFELNGGHLIVPPQLSEQAQELVDAHRFVSFEIRYPDGNWEPDRRSITLLSLDELGTLPKTVLKKVNRLCMAGDTIYDPERYWVDEQWDGDTLRVYLCRNGSDERTEIPYGTLLTDLSVLKDLTGLTELKLYGQPLVTLDGIQYLESLENLELKGCATLTDASAAFALQNLRALDLKGTSVTSIEGVQNLYHLERLNLEGLRIDDLSPISGLGGNTEVNGLPLPLMTVEEFCALPPSILNKIQRLSIAGGYVFCAWDNYRFEVDWDYDPPRYYIHDDSTDTRMRIEAGTMTDLSRLPVMDRLEVLIICAQPITSVADLRNQPCLNYLELQNCEQFTDPSSIFALTELGSVKLSNTGVTSIEGIQNLKKLTQLSIAHNGITDLTPIGGIDYSYAMQADERGNVPHFRLEIEDMSREGLAPEQFEALSAVPYFDYLDIDRNDYHLWTGVLKNTPIRCAQICDCNWDNEGFKAFIGQHPELEEIDLRRNPKLTDLTPLYALPNLHWIMISENMRDAQNSLGDDHGFGVMVED